MIVSGKDLCQLHVAVKYAVVETGITTERLLSWASMSFRDHLRWDLHAIFSLACSERHIGKNPGRLLVTPKDVKVSKNQS
jgi:hypothetical protein